ncbi:pyridoxamine 5'-phosphate oxidase family protein [Bacteroides fragilis]|nr:pyridoxamine 5'-phosphate oxidase family protein [Bacteroides fragilis]
MEYINDLIRRKDRLLPENEAMMLLENGEYGVLSMVLPDEDAYGIPINYVWDKQRSIYFHCAPEGRKLRILNGCNRVSFCVVGHTRIISNQFSTEYESIVISGTMICQLEEAEKRMALELLLDKYSPEDKKIGLKYMEKSFHRTHVLKLIIESVSENARRPINNVLTD